MDDHTRRTPDRPQTEGTPAAIPCLTEGTTGIWRDRDGDLWIADESKARCIRLQDDWRTNSTVLPIDATAKYGPFTPWPKEAGDRIADDLDRADDRLDEALALIRRAAGDGTDADPLLHRIQEALVEVRLWRGEAN